MTSPWQTLIVNAHLATMTNDTESYGTITDAAIAIADGKIAWLGKQCDLPDYDASTVNLVDAQGAWITPALIDCHTHIIYGGHRANEFELRLQGASYEEIARQGGGILSTVKATRQASEDELYHAALRRAQAMMAQGVTTLEIKSGYGLNTDTELKMLRVAQRLQQTLPITIQKTFLGAHALPPEYADDADSYIDLICHDMIPAIAEQQLADAVDVFCEGIGFNLAQTERVLTCAQAHQLAVKLHAEQLSNLGGTKLAARYQALSSDHLEYLDEAGIKAMAQAGMTAVLLPGAFYFLRETQLPPIELLRQYQVPIAIATDANPGSSPLFSLPLMLNMACTLFRLTPLEALAGVSCHAAKALGLPQKGQLAIGLDADLALWQITQPAELSYQFGVNPLIKLYHQGQCIITH
jgi:imidazolonepropionase